MSSIMLTISFNGNVLWDFLTVLTLLDIISMTFCQSLFWYSEMFPALSLLVPPCLPLHTQSFVSFNYLIVWSYKAKYIGKGNCMRNNIFTPSFSSSVPKDITRQLMDKRYVKNQGWKEESFNASRLVWLHLG